jgi:DNA-binding transcriptional ArsR family regulator
MNDDLVFKALADTTRRNLLDRLFERDGQTLTRLCQGMAASRQAVSKHLGILENAGLVAVVWEGREKRHFLNPVPVQSIAERWIHKFQQRQIRTITALKRALEKDN